MTEAFSDLVMPIFQRVIDLQDSLSWEESPSLERVRKQTKSWIDEAERRAVTDQGLSEEFAMAKYGLVALIDEVLTGSAWGQSVGWGSEEHVLEWDFYHSNLRAERFYEMAEVAYDAVSQARYSGDPLETFC
jgi:type VI protein secretion system component VasF